MTELDEVDAELLKALRVIRGDNDKNKKGDSSVISKAIVNAIETQGKDSTTQNADLLEAITEQNSLLEKLTELLSKKQEEKPKTTVVVVNKDPQQQTRSIPKEVDTSGTGVFAALDKADSDEEEVVAAALVAAADADAASGKPKTKSAAPIDRPSVVVKAQEAATARAAAAESKGKEKGSKKVITGPWAFVETNVALKRRGRIEKSSGDYKLLPKGTKKADLPEEAFAPLSQSDILNMEDSLFGKSNSTADVLKGDSFGKLWDRMRNPVDQYGKLKPPKWSTLDKKKSIRTYLPKLAIGGESQIKLNSGIYYLTIKYENDQIAEDNEAAIIIGEIAFDNRGFVLAAGADWNKLFGGQKQLEAPSATGKAGGKLKWHSSKVSEAWKDGDTLKFKIDTMTNTLGYTIQGVDDKEVRTGWMFSNVLAFTNNRMYTRFLQVFAYIGGSAMHAVAQGKATSFDGVRFSLKETRRSKSVLNLQAVGDIDNDEGVVVASDDE